MDIGRCFNEALDVYKRNWPILALAAFLYELLTLLSLTLLAGPLTGGICLMTIQAMRREDKRIELGAMFQIFDRFFSLIGLFYLTLVPMIFASLLCIVPGILLSAVWMFPCFLIVDRGEGVFSSLSRSYEATTRSEFRNYFLLALISFALSIAPTAIPYAGVVAAWFLMPIAWLLESAAYLQTFDEKKPPEKPLVV
ncbi:MAG: hypothetical protein FJ295_16960 [Planctomycetes bacterium]|nr:hypothetical protein [Planctomycetota bacterium]